MGRFYLLIHDLCVACQECCIVIEKGICFAKEFSEFSDGYGEFTEGEAKQIQFEKYDVGRQN